LTVSVYTVGDLCKKCYSCVRSCPTKAIQVHDGEAHIIPELCISCGYCVNMCSQGAKKIRSSVEVVNAMLQGEEPVYAMLAPSFPAAFLDLEPQRLSGALRQAGFDGVFEVAFGADLISYEYQDRFEQLLKEDGDGFLISSPCPSIVFLIEKHFPELAPYLANIASPMEAMARVINRKKEKGRTVFIGPCVAKKDEALRSRYVDEVLTFSELSELFAEKNIRPEQSEEGELDEPQANLGRIYPVSGGLLKAADIDDDLLESPVVVVEGAERVIDLLRALSTRVKRNEKAAYRFYDLLFCEGCIAGPDMVNDITFYDRKKTLIQYINGKTSIKDVEEWRNLNSEYFDVDLSCDFTPLDRELTTPPEEEIQKVLRMTNKFSPEDELNCGACGYASCREKAIAVCRGMAEPEMCLPYLIDKIEQTLDDLKENQNRLIHAEKLASMGQMAAGIAHEINNPLGVVLMYSHLLKEEIEEKTANSEDIDRIILEAERTRKIVRGILNFAREEKIERRSADINGLVTRSLEGVIGSFPKARYTVNLDTDDSLEEQWVDVNQLRQVFDNIIKNACEAMPGGGEIAVTTRREPDGFLISIRDAGTGISEENLPKLFSPFFTTKSVGKGTGLGLPVCYGIVKMHGGNIEAANNPEGGACFTITIKNYIREDSSAENLYNR